MKYWHIFRNDTRAVYELAASRRWQHAFTATLGLAACVMLGVSVQSLLPCVALIITAELLTQIGNKTLPEDDSKITIWHSYAMMLVCIISSGSFIAIGGIIMRQGDLASLVTGVVMSIGILCYLAIIYSSFVVHNILQIATSTIVLLTFIYSVHTLEVRQSPPWEWSMVLVVLTVFVANLMALRSHTQKIAIDLERARRRANARLREVEYFANHDELTGLLNRAAFKEIITKRYGSFIENAAIAMIDMNGFKPINDSYSHETGDAVLKETASRIKRNCAPDDLAARFGGDEFVILMHRVTSKDEAAKRMQKLMIEIAQPIQWDNMKLCVTGAIGISVPTKGADNTLKLLMSQADKAMYRCKTNEASKPEVFVAQHYTTSATLEDRKQLVAAMDDGMLRPYYQPKIDLQTGEVCGFEALARWRKSDGSLAHPREFIPKIEELNLHSKLLHTMLESVCSDMKHWQEKGIKPGQVSINISPKTVANHVECERIIETIRKFPELQDHLILEITEDVLIGRGSDKVQKGLHLLRANGFMVSLDDFGTGYSSLQHLGELEFDEIKIDTSFVRSMGHSKSADVLVHGILSMAQKLDIQVVAEGVETEYHRDQLIDMGCKIAQGFLWSYAVHPKFVPELILFGGEDKHPPYDNGTSLVVAQ